MYQNDPKKVLTPECRLSYANLVTPKAPVNNPGAEPKYSVTLLIPKSTNIIDELRASENAAAEDAVNTKWKGVRPAKLESVIHDGDGVRPSGEPFGAECKGCWVITASSKSKPYVCGADNINASSPPPIFTAVCMRVLLSTSTDISPPVVEGVGCGLRGVMKTRDGEPLSGAVVTASEFAGVGNSPTTQSAPAINPITGQPM